jgi:hypothetical protein
VPLAQRLVLCVELSRIVLFDYGFGRGLVVKK